MLVTSREVGYEQAPLDETRFIAYRLAPFDNQQVEEYAKKVVFGRQRPLATTAKNRRPSRS